MAKKLFLLTISFFVFHFISYAQPQGGSVKGKVFDETNDGFPFVNIAIDKSGLILTVVTVIMAPLHIEIANSKK